jgi:hypothetical protein
MEINTRRYIYIFYNGKTILSFSSFFLLLSKHTRILIGILEIFSSSKKGVYSIKVKADLLYFVGQGEMKSRTTGIYFTEK